MKNTELIDINKLRKFPDHPYKVTDNEEMKKLEESIREYGILQPIIVRPIEDDKYEIISGHRRVYASNRAGLSKVPAFIYEMDKDEACIKMVDSNMQRENILPSEKAFAYKLKFEALSRQGHRSDLTSGQVVPKSDKSRTAYEIGKVNNESYKTVQRYIRLTYLVPELLEYVDSKRISFTPAVHLSYLTDEEQYELLDVIESEEVTPSLSQSIRLQNLSKEGNLKSENIIEIMSEEKPNQKERIKIPSDQIKKYFPDDFTNNQIEDVIIKLCENYYKKLQRKKNEKER